MNTLETRKLFAQYILACNTATASEISRFHKMLDGTATVDEVLSREQWSMLSGQFYSFMCGACIKGFNNSI